MTSRKRVCQLEVGQAFILLNQKFIVKDITEDHIYYASFSGQNVARKEKFGRHSKQWVDVIDSSANPVYVKSKVIIKNLLKHGPCTAMQLSAVVYPNLKKIYSRLYKVLNRMISEGEITATDERPKKYKIKTHE